MCFLQTKEKTTFDIDKVVIHNDMLIIVYKSMLN